MSHVVSPARLEPAGPLSPPQPVSEAVSRAERIFAWLSHHPLVAPSLGVAGGIGLDAQVPIPWPAAVAAFIGCGVGLLSARRRAWPVLLTLFIAAAGVGTVLHDLHFRRLPERHIARWCGSEPLPVRLRGTVRAAPAIVPARSGRITWLPQLDRTRLLVEAESVEGVDGDVSVCGLVGVLVREPVPAVEAGDRVELFGTLHVPMPPANPGERDWPLVRRRGGVWAELSCQHAANVSRLSAGDRLAGALAAVRRWAVAAMHERAFDEEVPGSRLLDALVLGQRSAVDPELNQAFVNTGTVHYLSVSGAHVGALMSAVWGIGWLARRDRRRCSMAAMVAVSAYALLAEPSPAIIRSAIMALVFCVTILMRRPIRSPNALAAAALIILIWRPTQLFDAGFQLSFATLLAVMFVSPPVHAAGKQVYDKLLRRDDPLLQPTIQRMLNPPGRARRAAGWLLNKLGWATAISASAWLAGSLLGAYHFGQIAPWGWLNTILIIVPMDVLLLLGLAKTALSAVLPPLSGLLGWPLKRLTFGLIGFVELLNRLPGSGLSAPAIPAWLTGLGLAWMGLMAVATPLRIRVRWIAATGAILLGAGLWNVSPNRPADTLRLHVLAIGDGTACVIELPDGRSVLYDLGTRPPYDLMRWSVGPFLAHRRIGSIDTLILSHPQLDHFSAVPDLLDRIEVGEVITSPYFVEAARTAGPAVRLIQELRERGPPWRTTRAGEQPIGDSRVTVEVLWPPGDIPSGITEVNDTSIVLRLTCGGRHILLCGDIEDRAERRLLATTNLGADVLLLPHHGGVGSLTEEFIEAVNPLYCVRSSGQKDRDTTNGLLELMRGRRYLNTADRGAVTIEVGPDGVEVTSVR